MSFARSVDGPPPRLSYRQRHPLTLRTKLIVGMVAVIVVLSSVIGVVTEVFLSRYLVRQLDTGLKSTQDRFGGLREGARTGGVALPPPPADVTPPGAPASAPAAAASVPSLPETPAPGTRLSCSDIATGSVGRQPDNSVFAVVQDGSVRAVLRQNFASCTVLPASASAPLSSIVPYALPVTRTLGRYGEFRLAARSGGKSGEVLVTGLSLDGVIATQRQLAVIMALVAGIAVVAAGLVVFAVVRRSVRPLERVAATARKVSTLPLSRGDVDLTIRVPTRDTDPRTEVGQVGAALNQMLGHVSGALQARQASETRVRKFVADASHELRTPLAAIRGYAELARRSDDDRAAIAHALRRVESESARMTTLVDDLLLLARLDSGRPLASADVDLSLLVVDAVSDSRVVGPDHRWRLDLPEEPVTVLGDPARLHQVLSNLLTNARIHTPPGTVVTTGLTSEEGSVALTVTDNGPGIPAPAQAEVFGRFIRGPSCGQRAAGSSGLGLAIVSAVVAAHHGSVSLRSRPGVTEFRVRLPRDGRAPDAVHDQRSESAPDTSLSNDSLH